MKFNYSQPVSHRSPVNPGGQLQLNSLTPSLHVPLFKQGLLPHSFISKEKNNPRQLNMRVRSNYLRLITYNC